MEKSLPDSGKECSAEEGHHLQNFHVSQAIGNGQHSSSERVSLTHHTQKQHSSPAGRGWLKTANSHSSGIAPVRENQDWSEVGLSSRGFSCSISGLKKSLLLFTFSVLPSCKDRASLPFLLTLQRTTDQYALILSKVRLVKHENWARYFRRLKQKTRPHALGSLGSKLNEHRAERLIKSCAASK